MEKKPAVLVVDARPVPGDKVPQFVLLGQRGGVEGKRPWCDSIEDERFEWFTNRPKAHAAAQTYGGQMVDSDAVERLGLDDGWKQLEPATFAPAGSLGL